jgi:hypothetical protein
MVEKHALAEVERCNLRHLVVGQSEPEHVEILSHPVLADRLWDDDDSTLKQPPQRNLRDRFALGAGDAGEVALVKKPLSPSANGPQASICTP